MPLSPAVAMAILFAPPTFGLERLDLVSEEPGTWVNYDLPMIDVTPAATAVRWVEQVKLVWALPAEHLYLGTSYTSLSLSYERPFAHGSDLFFTAGLHTRLLLPRGAFAGIAFRFWRVRISIGAIALSSANWAWLDWSHWTVLPTVGFGIGRQHEPQDFARLR